MDDTCLLMHLGSCSIFEVGGPPSAAIFDYTLTSYERIKSSLQPLKDTQVFAGLYGMHYCDNRKVTLVTSTGEVIIDCQPEDTVTLPPGSVIAYFSTFPGLLSSSVSVIDTQLLYPANCNEDLYAKPSLATLTRRYLRRSTPVSPTECAKAAIDLAMLHIRSGQGRVVYSEPVKEQLLNPDPDSILECIHMARERVSALYLRGSRAVGTNLPDADWDFVMVLRDLPLQDTRLCLSDIHLKYSNIDIAVYDHHTFSNFVMARSVWALEAVFGSAWISDFNYRDLLTTMAASMADTSQLRSSVSLEAGRKWRSAKRAVDIGDLHRCRKHIFICLRFLVYGIEIAKTGCIPDIQCANHYWEQLKEQPYTTWSEFETAWKPIKEQLTLSFRSLSPKKSRFTYQVSKSRKVPCDVQNANEWLSVSEFLQSRFGGGAEGVKAGLDYLERVLYVRHVFHMSVQGLVSLHYTPRSAMDNYIVSQCRGIILDTLSNWRVIAFPFIRFHDITTPQGRESALEKSGTETGGVVTGNSFVFDYDNCVIEEKLDGSMMLLYFHAGVWHVASSHRPDASGILCNSQSTFADVFWRIFNASMYSLPDETHQGITFIFEMTSCDNVIIVRYQDSALTLIGARDLRTMNEIDLRDLNVAERYNWNTVHSVPFVYNGDPARYALQMANGDCRETGLCEGFVLRDIHWNRVKVKSSEYIRMSWLFPLCTRQQVITKRHLMTVILSNEQRKFREYVPEFAGELDYVESVYNTFIGTVNVLYADIQQGLNQKEFAAYVLAQGTGSLQTCCLFSMRKGVIIQEYLRKLPVAKVTASLFPE